MMPTRALVAFVFTITVFADMPLFQANKSTSKFPQQIPFSFDTSYFCTFRRSMLALNNTHKIVPNNKRRSSRFIKNLFLSHFYTSRRTTLSSIEFLLKIFRRSSKFQISSNNFLATIIRNSDNSVSVNNGVSKKV